MKEFLADIGSEIGRTTPFSGDVYSRMQLTSPLNAHDAPRNVALLFFSDDPERVFPGATIDVVQFADDAGGDLIEEKTIRGPLHHQVRQTLSYLDSLGSTVIEKVPGRAEVDRMVTYPHEAIREAVVNAVYHRSYQEVEPTKIYWVSLAAIHGVLASAAGVLLEGFGELPDAPLRVARWSRVPRVFTTSGPTASGSALARPTGVSTHGATSSRTSWATS